MQRPLILAAFAALALYAAPAIAAPPSDVSAQARKRPPASITVRPQRRAYPYRSTHALYPPAYEIEYPGPNAVRRCAGQYVFEARASGMVIVPRMRCRWAPG